jgi:hypothetical protein
MAAGMQRRSFLLLPLAMALASACTPLLKLAAGPPAARARQAKLAIDAAGQVTGISLDVDLYNENAVDLRAERFQFRLEAAGQVSEGEVAAQGALPRGTWAPVQLYVPIDRAHPVFAAIMAGEPFVLTGQLQLGGGIDGLAVGVSGEGVIASHEAGGPRVAFVSTEGGAR